MYIFNSIFENFNTVTTCVYSTFPNLQISFVLLKEHKLTLQSPSTTIVFYSIIIYKLLADTKSVYIPVV